MSTSSTSSHLPPPGAPVRAATPKLLCAQSVKKSRSPSPFLVVTYGRPHAYMHCVAAMHPSRPKCFEAGNETWATANPEALRLPRPRPARPGRSSPCTGRWAIKPHRIPWVTDRLDLSFVACVWDKPFGFQHQRTHWQLPKTPARWRGPHIAVHSFNWDE